MFKNKNNEKFEYLRDRIDRIEKRIRDIYAIEEKETLSKIELRHLREDLNALRRKIEEDEPYITYRSDSLLTDIDKMHVSRVLLLLLNHLGLRLQGESAKIVDDAAD